MATATTNPSLEGMTPPAGDAAPTSSDDGSSVSNPSANSPTENQHTRLLTKRNQLQELLAFSALQQHVSRKQARDGLTGGRGFADQDVEEEAQFALDDVLQLVAQRTMAITGADGLAIALPEGGEVILRTAVGRVRPDLGAQIDSDASFSGACLRTKQIVTCDDSEADERVNPISCRCLGARSMVAVPLCARDRAVGLLEAFWSKPSGFNDDAIRNLTHLADLISGAFTPEEEARFAESAQTPATNLEAVPRVEEIASTTTTSLQSDHAVSTETALVIARKLLEDSTSTEEVATAAATNVLYETKLEPAPAFGESENRESPVSENAVTGEASQGLPTLERHATSKNSSRALLMFLLIVIAVAMVGGVWLKLKAMHYPHVTKQTGETSQEPLDTLVSGAKANAPEVAGETSDSAHDNSEATSLKGELTSSLPAKTQESPGPPRVTGIRYWSSTESSTVVLSLEDQVQYEAHRLSHPDRIYFDLHDTLLAPDLEGKSLEVGDALLNRIRVAQPVAGITRVVLETKAIPEFSVSLQPNPYRLVIEVHKIRQNSKGGVNLFSNAPEAGKNTLALAMPRLTKEDMELRGRVPKLHIVVDAGHGGRDHGTVGRDGLLEKDLVLEITQRLGRLLEKRLGMVVIYTRNDDHYVPLDDRASIANQAQADLFISVHANYSDLPSARGVETYYTNFFMVPASKDVDTDSGTSNARISVPTSLSAGDLQDRGEQSRRLAASVQRSLFEMLSPQNPGLRDRGIKESSFVVLTESTMPGILAEVSFVSSPADEQKLRSDTYREQVAEALYKGIARYAASSHGVKVASAGR